MHFALGDDVRAFSVRHSQKALVHADEVFLSNATFSMWRIHSWEHPGSGRATAVYTARATVGASGAVVCFRPGSGIELTMTQGYGHTSPVDVCINDVLAWRLARELGPPWTELVRPTIWHDPPRGIDILASGPLSLVPPGGAGLPQPGFGFARMVADAAFFHALVGAQDQHDTNLRCTLLPPRLGLIDHGFAFARPGDLANPASTAGLLLRLRHGERTLGGLDYRGVGELSPRLEEHERSAIDRLMADLEALLGIASMLPEDRADAMRDRVRRMDAGNTVLPWGDF
jgi:hypothetical protein